jgi:hypothetical protein
MRKSVADQTEFAITYFTTWRWFDGFRISLDALHEFLPRRPGLHRHRQLWRGQFVARERVHRWPLSKISGGPSVGLNADASVWTLYIRRRSGENRLR